MDQRRELGAFLRTRRERLNPVEAGLPVRGHRRTPGLRREEVAELAEVSVDYMVRLEQGRGPHPSPTVLEALSRALLMSHDEREHLFDLARRRPPSLHRVVAESHLIGLHWLVHALSPAPAMLINRRFDIVAWNPEMAEVRRDIPEVPQEERNIISLVFLHAGTPSQDRERVAHDAAAFVRGAWAAHPEDQGLAALVLELTRRSDEFSHYWSLRDAKIHGRGRRPLLHPEAGALAVDFEVLAPLADHEHRLIVYHAADSRSQAALDSIVG